MFNPFQLKKPIGEAFNMDLDDSLNTKKALVDLGHMEVPQHGLTEFPDRPMIDGVKSFQRDQNLQVDGVMKPDGPTIKRLNDTLVAKRKDQRPPGSIVADSIPAKPKPQPVNLLRPTLPTNVEPKPLSPPIKLKRPITSATNVDFGDTGRVKKALNDLGLLDARDYGLDEFPDEPMFRAIKAFQRQQDLQVDGEMRPDGETEIELNKIFLNKEKVDAENENEQDQVEVAFAPAVPIGAAFAEWLMGLLSATTVAAAMAAFAAFSKPRQQELRKRYREETGNNDDEDDFCFERWEVEKSRCQQRPNEWIGGCIKRANNRFVLCRDNGGRPHPDEPPEWSKADEEVSSNTNR